MGEKNNQLYYYHGDHLGSAQIVTDPEGKIYEQLEYTPYGELWVEHLKTTIEATPFRFTGKERDGETGLYYYGARYLNPQTSMWLSADPAMGEYIPQAPVNDDIRKQNQNLPGMGGVFNYMNLHVYHYAGNNPVKLTDPDGREEFYFLYVFNANNPGDQQMKDEERASINEEVEYLREMGISVMVIENATKDDVLSAFSDREAIMIVTSGYGYDEAKIPTADGKTVTPADLKNVSPSLRILIFENCYQGDYIQDWRNALGTKIDIVGWSGLTYTYESLSFNDMGLFDRKNKNFISYSLDVIETKTDKLKYEQSKANR
jgi:RHS repeat-associated protein